MRTKKCRYELTIVLTAHGNRSGKETTLRRKTLRWKIEEEARVAWRRAVLFAERT